MLQSVNESTPALSPSYYRNSCRKVVCTLTLVGPINHPSLLLLPIITETSRANFRASFQGHFAGPVFRGSFQDHISGPVLRARFQDQLPGPISKTSFQGQFLGQFPGQFPGPIFRANFKANFLDTFSQTLFLGPMLHSHNQGQIV